MLQKKKKEEGGITPTSSFGHQYARHWDFFWKSMKN
jgi:hypothetical protein